MIVASAADQLVALSIGAVGLMLAYAGISKGRQPNETALALHRLGVVGQPRRSAGYAFAISELVLGVTCLTLTGRPFTVSLVATAGFFVAAAYVVARNLRLGRVVACFCFGDANKPISSRTFARALSLAAIVTGGLIAVVLGLASPGLDRDRFVTIVSAAALLGVSSLVLGLAELLRASGDARAETQAS